MNLNKIVEKRYQIEWVSKRTAVSPVDYITVNQKMILQANGIHVFRGPDSQIDYGGI